MAHISTARRGVCEADLSVQVRAIEVDLATVLVDDLTRLQY